MKITDTAAYQFPYELLLCWNNP